MEWSMIIFICVFCSTYYLLVRRNIRKSTRELQEFLEREGVKTRERIQFIFHSSEQTPKEAGDQ